MSDYDIHSCGYYCDRHACIVAQRNELRDKLFSKQPQSDGVALTSIKHPHLGKPSKYKLSKESLETVVLEGPEPEPIAYINVEKRTLEWAKLTRWETPTVVKMDKVPLYTKKEWVGLTDEELLDLADMAYANDLELLQTLQAKLKEKNNG